MNKNEVSIGFIGSKKVKGVPHKVRVYTVMGKYDKIIRNVQRKKRKVTKGIRKAVALFLTLLLIGASVAALVLLLVYKDALF